MTAKTNLGFAATQIAQSPRNPSGVYVCVNMTDRFAGQNARARWNERRARGGLLESSDPQFEMVRAFENYRIAKPHAHMGSFAVGWEE